MAAPHGFSMGYVLFRVANVRVLGSKAERFGYGPEGFGYEPERLGYEPERFGFMRWKSFDERNRTVAVRKQSTKENSAVRRPLFTLLVGLNRAFTGYSA